MKPIETAITRIFAADGSIVGLGFLITESRIMTCAHVVADAVGIERDDPQPPSHTISVDFPLVDNNKKCTSRVVVWLPSRDGTDDIAVLELREAAPSSAKPANLVTVDKLWGAEFGIYGFPRYNPKGVWAKGKVSGLIEGKRIQIDALEGNISYFIEPGFSGSPVYCDDPDINGVIGMAVSAESDPNIKAGFMIPTDNLQKFAYAKRIDFQDISYLITLIRNELSPLLDLLGEKELAKQTRQQCDQLEDKLNRSYKTPIALIGTTGSGKTTLINAIIEQELGASADVGSQSANLLTVEMQSGDYLVEVEYCEIEEIIGLVKQALTDLQPDPTLRTDLQGISSDLQHTLSQIFKHPEKSLRNLAKVISPNNGKILPSSLKEDVKKRLELGVLNVTFENTFTGIKELKEFVFEHTNTHGAFSGITREVKIKGPFSWLPTGAILQDLPGLGDINLNRLGKTIEAVKNALQVILVVDAKGIKDDVKEILYQSNLINYMLSNIQLKQIMIIGTHLDNVYLNETELRKLGFDPASNPSDNEILIAQYRSWKQLVKEHWRTLLYTYQNERKQKKHNFGNVERLVDATNYIPTSPKGYMTIRQVLTGRPDPRYKSLHLIDDVNSTGIPEVRLAISNLASNQVHLYWQRILDHVSTMVDLILLNGKVTIQILLKDIESNEHDTRLMTELVKITQHILTQKIHYKIKTVLVKETVKSVSPLKEIIKNDWFDLSEEQATKLIRDELSKAYYPSIIAALRRNEVTYKTKGKHPLEISIAARIGKKSAREGAQHLRDNLFSPFIEKVRIRLDEIKLEIQKQIDLVLHEVEANVENSSSGKLLVEKVKIAQRQFDAHISELKEQMTLRTITLADQMFDIILSTIADNVKFVSEDILNDEEVSTGSGATDRIIIRFAKLLSLSKNSVINRTTTHIRDNLYLSLDALSLEIEQEIDSARKIYFEVISETRDNLLNSGDIKDKREVATKIERTISDIEMLYGGYLMMP